MPKSEDILTSAGARHFLKIGRTVLWRLTRDGQIPSYRMGSGPNASLRYRRTELMRWLTGRRLKPDGGVKRSARGPGHPAGHGGPPGSAA